MLGKDPWDFTTQDVILNFCHRRDLWADRPTAVLPDPAYLTEIITAQSIDGPTLLCDLSDATLRDGLNIQAFGQRVAILHAIKQLRNHSEKYKARFHENTTQLEQSQTQQPQHKLPKRAALTTTARPDIDEEEDNFTFVRSITDPLKCYSAHRATKRSLWKGLTTASHRESPSEWDVVLENNPTVDVTQDPGISCKIGEHEHDLDTIYVSSDESEDEHQHIKPKAKGLAPEDVADVINLYIADHKDKWLLVELPKLQEKAVKFWKASRGRAGTRIAESDRARLEHFYRLLAKTRRQVEADEWSSSIPLRAMCAAMDVTLDNIEEYKWRLEVHASKARPEPTSFNSRIASTASNLQPSVATDGDEISLRSDDDLSEAETFTDTEDGPLRGGTPSTDPALPLMIAPSASSAALQAQWTRLRVESMSFEDIKSARLPYALIFKILLSYDLDMRTYTFAYVDEHSVDHITTKIRRHVTWLNESSGLSPIHDDDQRFGYLIASLYLCWLACSEEIAIGNQNVPSQLIDAALHVLRTSVPDFIEDVKAIDEALDQEDERIEVHHDGKQSTLVVDHDVASKMTAHQRDGISFLWRETVLAKLPGCLLAHMMGLGKTMQAITFVSGLMLASEAAAPSTQLPDDLQRGYQIRIVVVCPAGLIDNWRDELNTWLPERLDQHIPRITIEKSDGILVGAWVVSGGFAFVSFEMMARLMRADTGPTSVFSTLTQNADIVIADEAHKFKNDATLIWKAVQAFTTRRRIALTGSPLANNVTEYINLLNWVAPELLKTIDVRRDFEQPIALGFNRVDSTPEDRFKAKMALHQFASYASVKVHRRGESCLAESLPDKNYFVLKLVPTQGQVDAFNHLITFQSDHHATARRHQLLGLQSLLAHMTFSLDIYLQKFREQPREEDAQAPLDIPIEGSAQRPIDLEDSASQGVEVPPTFAVEHCQRVQRRIEEQGRADPTAYPKPAMIMQIVEMALARDERIVIFSHWRPILQRLETWLRGDHGSIVARMDGMTRPSERQELCKHLNAGRLKILLASPRAGGLGLNMQGASRVILADFTFNPVWEQQAVARLWRLGQLKPVSVYHLVVDGTFEAQLFERTVWKKELALEVVDGIDTEQTAGAMANLLQPPAGAQREDLTKWQGRDPILDALTSDKSEFKYHIASIREVRDTSREGSAAREFDGAGNASSD